MACRPFSDWIRRNEATHCTRPVLESVASVSGMAAEPNEQAMHKPKNCRKIYGSTENPLRIILRLAAEEN